MRRAFRFISPTIYIYTNAKMLNSFCLLLRFSLSLSLSFILFLVHAHFQFHQRIRFLSAVASLCSCCCCYTFCVPSLSLSRLKRYFLPFFISKGPLAMGKLVFESFFFSLFFVYSFFFSLHSFYAPCYQSQHTNNYSKKKIIFLLHFYFPSFLFDLTAILSFVWLKLHFFSST